MLVKRTGGPDEGEAFFGDYALAAPMESRNGHTAFSSPGERRGTVGLSVRCAAEVEVFLREEGFLAERTSVPDEHAVFIDGYPTLSGGDEAALLSEIEASPNAVLRLWRWPDRKRSAFTISADVDSITLMDFVRRAMRF